MFRKVLIANRGEIAVRVIRACRELSIPTVAIYSEADRAALHVRLADEAHLCGPSPARDSYLRGESIVEIARRAGAEAIHPGYGFLAEDADFADRCEAAGIVFIGPGSDAIRAMGTKLGARRLMDAAGVAVVPGSVEIKSDAEAERWAEQIGYPVMVKASAGGGGKGMRLVRSPAELPKALERVRGESKSAFGDDAIYFEKVMEAPRHIEVQILADAHGNTVHLGERECSIQRRHQKLLEEAPANRVGAELREAMGRAALTAAESIGYRGAGTCEFLVDERGEFYFLEMNTRIQVEHAVTEAVTGIDLVKQMILIAAGEPLSIAQEDVVIRGHAIEARIYAEDPARGFAPSPGRVGVYRPPGGFGVRVDSGVAQGDSISTHYDPLVAKLICWGVDREEAIARLGGALREFAVQGIATTIPFHRRVVGSPAFVAGSYRTDFVAAELGSDEAASGEASGFIAAGVAAIAVYRQANPTDVDDVPAAEYEVVAKGSEAAKLTIRRVSTGYEISTQDRTARFDTAGETESLSVIVEGRQYEALVSSKGARFDVILDGLARRFQVRAKTDG